MKILVVGNGGREHALCWRLKSDDPSIELLAAPGNPGTAEIAHNFDVRADDVAGILELARREAVDVTVIGPEGPLALGIVDAFREAGLAVFGPTRAAAEIETDKSFAKALMRGAGVPTARAIPASSPAAGIRAVRELADAQGRVVVKATGLAAGKGVIVATSVDEGERAVEFMLGGGLGEAGAAVLVEEFMEGEELSLFAITDGTRAIPLLAAQDHKRLEAGDHGPNTGGMGAYAPVSLADPRTNAGQALVREVMERIVHPTLRAMRDEGRPFTGLLYAGLMLTPDGPKVVEFNCRFGDPETQSVLTAMTIDPPLLSLIVTVATGKPLPEAHALKVSGCSVTTVVAAENYPGPPRTGDPIRLPRFDDVGVNVFHAGTRRRATGELESAGGRVLGITAVAPTFAEAQRLSQEYADLVELPGKQVRDDIGWRELRRTRRRPPGGEQGAGAP